MSDVEIESEIKDTGIEINADGTRHLGAAVGTPNFKTLYVSKKISTWIKAVENLAEIGATEPHAAFSAFTHCLQSQWTFVSRAMPDISALFEPLEQAIRHGLLKTLLRRDVSDCERELISLPARFGGLGIFNPTESSNIAYQNSSASLSLWWILSCNRRGISNLPKSRPLSPNSESRFTLRLKKRTS